ncbi:hypothetical protein [Actinomadura opuntiae]|uniref:hypothetical protein n=1 Tax=Actinomadura sp. OS1-43 TaxID=604315 RepID=UPI00255B1339|nr:hypothetical protein [Actinomadura sp. OS1-43]MDL4818655.1 hypothetical protein [Actinomadura sp. OS1-43]
MRLIAGRLEGAKLDQRTLPRALLPEQALAGARAIFGPSDDLPLPEPPGGAAELVEQFWAGTQVELAHDGTAVDALREGLHRLAESGMSTRSEPAMLLPALYLALVGRDEEAVDDAGERAVIWALSLAPDSPLLPITDILLLAPQADSADRRHPRSAFRGPRLHRAGPRRGPVLEQLAWQGPDQSRVRTRALPCPNA